MWDIQDYSSVSVTGNNLVAFDGTATYVPNTPFIPALGLCSVNGATVSGNTFNNFYETLEQTACWDWPGSPASTSISECGNTYWLTEPILGVAPNPKTDGIC